MNYGVLARSLFSKLAFRGVCVTSSLVLLSSCAHRDGSAKASTTAGTASASTTVVSSSRHYRSVSNTPLDESSDRIISLVETAKLVQSGDNFLIFARSRNTPAATASSSLYEDAIALGRLRSTLKTVPGIPHSSFREVTVHNGGAIIPIEDTLPASTTADIVDTALTVDQVRSVRLNLPTAPR